jgi:hypothetical protein
MTHKRIVKVVILRNNAVCRRFVGAQTLVFVGDGLSNSTCKQFVRIWEYALQSPRRRRVNLESWVDPISAAPRPIRFSNHWGS